ncbi:peptidylprolyl isomerase [Croceibacter atlanticus]|uniref:peptidylprolyl isomerase n=1 Tax=Croceibacter atlanticus TaxID=313588 RepID=UPI0024BA0CD9|nr:peptidylprolyl isomerase [Croceibacter atlanticus]
MKLYRFLFVFCLLIAGNTIAQELDKQIIMTLDGEPVYASDFVRVYQKNLDLVQDESQKDVDEYLKLFIDYRLKLREAYEQGLDTTLKFQREFKTYRNQLARNFLTDNNVTEALVQEAYDRTVNEVNASHILIRVDQNATPEDTLKAYSKIKDIREKAVNGRSFETLAKTYSEDPSAKKNGGELGWFTALKMVYAFEEQAYTVPVGDVSEPFRTRFGYHILKVNDRRASAGEVEVAHIMVSQKPKDTVFNPKDRIEELYLKVKQGEDFGVLAKQFSDDRNSARREGKLDRFGSGKLNSEVFEKKAFSLTKAGQVTEPFETQYGWHIIKLIDRFPIPSFNEMRGELEKKVTKDSRANLISDALVASLKDHYSIGDFSEAKSFFSTYVTKDVKDGNWAISDNSTLDQPLFKLRDSVFKYRDFAKFIYNKQVNKGLSGDKNTAINNWLKEYVDGKVLAYHRDHLEQEDKEFSNIVSEYRDGLLLFDLMEMNIWNKAKKDTLGLKTYYETNKQNYLWDKRVNVTMAKVNNKADAKKVRNLMKKGVSEVDVKSQINSDESMTTLFSNGTFNVEDEVLPKKLKIKQGISKVFEEDNYYTVVNIKDVLPAGPKTFKEAKGTIVSDYQDYLEKNWIASLRTKYSVNINDDTVNLIKTKLED